MRKIRIAYIIVFTILISVALSVALSHAGKANVYDLADNDGTFKLFEDGVTYKVHEGHGFLYDAPDVSIIHEGNEYDCLPDGYHSNQYLSPFCVEIILRSIP